VLTFLKVQGVDASAISTVEHAKVKAYESRPPLAIAARHRVENAIRKVDHFVCRMAEFEKQQAQLANTFEETKGQLEEGNFADVEGPIAVGLAGLDEAVTGFAEGQSALEARQRLQRE
ncbi:unnamed protein product, partial [Prorocentrum cordatum]